MVDEAAFQHIKTYLLGQLSARTLLLNMAARRAQQPGYAYYMILLDGRTLGDGSGDLADYDGPAGEIVDRLNADPEVAARLETLLRMGFEMRFGIYDEPWRRDLHLTLIQNEKADRRLRAEAHRDAGATTPWAAAAYDKQWQLYFNQHYAPDWEEWRAREPLVELP